MDKIPTRVYEYEEELEEKIYNKKKDIEEVYRKMGKHLDRPYTLRVYMRDLDVLTRDIIDLEGKLDAVAVMKAYLDC